MRFDKAYKELIDNLEPITRISWEQGCLIFNTETEEIEHDNCTSIGQWQPTHEDIIADDWVAI